MNGGGARDGGETCGVGKKNSGKVGSSWLGVASEAAEAFRNFPKQTQRGCMHPGLGDALSETCTASKEGWGGWDCCSGPFSMPCGRQVGVRRSRAAAGQPHGQRHGLQCAPVQRRRRLAELHQECGLAQHDAVASPHAHKHGVDGGQLQGLGRHKGAHLGGDGGGGGEGLRWVGGGGGGWGARPRWLSTRKQNPGGDGRQKFANHPRPTIRTACAQSARPGRPSGPLSMCQQGPPALDITHLRHERGEADLAHQRRLAAHVGPCGSRDKERAAKFDDKMERKQGRAQLRAAGQAWAPGGGAPFGRASCRCGPAGWRQAFTYGPDQPNA